MQRRVIKRIIPKTEKKPGQKRSPKKPVPKKKSKGYDFTKQKTLSRIRGKTMPKIPQASFMVSGTQSLLEKKHGWSFRKPRPVKGKEAARIMTIAGEFAKFSREFSKHRNPREARRQIELFLKTELGKEFKETTREAFIQNLKESIAGGEPISLKTADDVKNSAFYRFPQFFSWRESSTQLLVELEQAARQHYLGEFIKSVVASAIKQINVARFERELAPKIKAKYEEVAHLGYAELRALRINPGSNVPIRTQFRNYVLAQFSKEFKGLEQIQKAIIEGLAWKAMR